MGRRSNKVDTEREVIILVRPSLDNMDRQTYDNFAFMLLRIYFQGSGTS